MKKRSFLAQIIGIFALVSMLAAVVSCGRDETSSVYTAPYGSTITINPVPLGTTIGSPAPGCTGAYWQEQMFTITVVGPDAQPMNNISMVITLDWAPNFSSGNTQVMQLYDSAGGAAVAVPFETKTDSLGTKVVFVKNDVGCEYKGSLGVHAASAFNSVPIEVKVGT